MNVEETDFVNLLFVLTWQADRPSSYGVYNSSENDWEEPRVCVDCLLMHLARHLKERNESCAELKTRQSSEICGLSDLEESTASRH